jgi:hypothetical protein
VGGGEIGHKGQFPKPTYYYRKSSFMKVSVAFFSLSLSLKVAFEKYTLDVN